jgi:hypothetical protein
MVRMIGPDRSGSRTAGLGIARRASIETLVEVESERMPNFPVNVVELIIELDPSIRIGATRAIAQGV